MNKQVTAVVRLAINYVFHLMAVARVGFDSEYADEYRDSVLPEDVAFIRKHKSLLTFGMGSGSDLVVPIIFLPSYFDLDSQDALKQYFSLLDSCCRRNDFSPFLKEYADYFERLRVWMPIEEYESDLRSTSQHRETLRRLGEIVIRNFPNYVNTVWIKEKDELERVAGKINERFAGKDRIAQWETLTGKPFKLDRFAVLLCSAIKNGPNANSLGYDSVVFYHDTPFDWMIQFISHEIGTHILIDDLRSVAESGRFEWKTVYAAYESLARFYNSLILAPEELIYELPKFDEKEYRRTFREIYDNAKGVSPRDLLVKGIELRLGK